jgi:hypothetical protein
MGGFYGSEERVRVSFLPVLAVFFLIGRFGFGDHPLDESFHGLGGLLFQFFSLQLLQGLDAPAAFLAGIRLEDGAVNQHSSQVNHLELESEKDNSGKNLLKEGMMDAPELGQGPPVGRLLTRNYLEGDIFSH